MIVLGDLGEGGSGAPLVGGALLIVLGDLGGSGALRAGTLRIVEGELFSGSLLGDGDRSETDPRSEIDPRFIVGDFLILTALRVFFLKETWIGLGSSQTS